MGTWDDAADTPGCARAFDGQMCADVPQFCVVRTAYRLRVGFGWYALDAYRVVHGHRYRAGGDMGSREHRRVLARGSQSIADLFDGTIGAGDGLRFNGGVRAGFERRARAV